MDETNDSTISSKTAIVVIHGMGNQYPMETITDFVDNLFKIEENKDKDDNPKVFTPLLRELPAVLINGN
ncbi:MAG: hypothetical protein IPG87_07905 [Saprospiraceae bacterium]|nr:hypothetical protein [Candidatus Vicinibacter affinis]